MIHLPACFSHKTLCFLLGFACLSVGASSISAQDWPGWMGPNRDNVWQAKDVLEKFPAGGPKIVWKSPVANGYSGPAVVGNRVYLTDFTTKANIADSNFSRALMEGVESVKCLDADTGKEVWKKDFPTPYAISYPNGPRATPLVEADRVYTLGAEGRLICFQRETGNVIWSRELKQDYKTNSPLWGYAAHPMIDGDRLICVAGGEGSQTVALDKLTGKEIWRYGTASEQGYCPVHIFTHAGQRQMLVMSPDWLASINPDNGQQIWKQAYQADNGSIIMTPVVVQNKYIFVGGFNQRNLLLELSPNKNETKELLRDKPKQLISPVNVQPFVIDNIIYGMNADGTLMAIEIPSGNRLWETGQPVSERPVRSGTCFIVQNGDRFFLFTENGELVICNLTKQGYKELDRAKVIEPVAGASGRPVVWSAPAFAGTRMYVRSDKELVCIELKK
jgi:outer membrane protein assembly factor BamB